MQGATALDCPRQPATCGATGPQPAPLCPHTPPPSLPLLGRRWYRCHVDLSTFEPPPRTDQPPANQAAAAAAAGDGSSGGPDSIPYLPDAARLSAEEFEARFDGPGQPVLLGGLTADWPGACGGGWWVAGGECVGGGGRRSARQLCDTRAGWGLHARPWLHASTPPSHAPRRRRAGGLAARQPGRAPGRPPVQRDQALPRQRCALQSHVLLRGCSRFLLNAGGARLPSRPTAASLLPTRAPPRACPASAWPAVAPRIPPTVPTSRPLCLHPAHCAYIPPTVPASRPLCPHPAHCARIPPTVPTSRPPSRPHPHAAGRLPGLCGAAARRGALLRLRRVRWGLGRLCGALVGGQGRALQAGQVAALGEEPCFVFGAGVRAGSGLFASPVACNMLSTAPCLARWGRARVWRLQRALAHLDAPPPCCNGLCEVARELLAQYRVPADVTPHFLVCVQRLWRGGARAAGPVPPAP